MNATTRNAPLVSRLDGLFEELLRPAAPREEARGQALAMRLDVRETDDGYVVCTELPGARKEDIHVEIEGNEVTITAETRREAAGAGTRFLRVERRFGKSARRIALPQELDEHKALARFADGVLELTLPRKAAPSGRRIQVS